MVDLEPCVKCGGRAEIYPSYGGGGRGELTFYYVECKKCGHKEDHLGTNGTKRSAVAQYNRYAKGKR